MLTPRPWLRSGAPRPAFPKTISDAIEECLKDAAARNLDFETYRKYRTMTRQLQRFADDKGVSVRARNRQPSLHRIPGKLERWRAQWRKEAGTIEIVF
jgi:hypothetical protein